MEKIKALSAALALRRFSVEQLSGLSGVNPNTARAVLRDSEFLRHDRGGAQAPDQGRGRGRPADQWVVADIDGLRSYLESISPPTAYTTSNLAVEPGDEMAIAVNVAEDTLAQAPGESDPELRELLFESARSSLLLPEGPDGATTEYWWQDRDDSYAARARGVDALATLAVNMSHEQGVPTESLESVAPILADAMFAAPERAERTYFAPFTHVLANSGEFAPMLWLRQARQKPSYPLPTHWIETRNIDVAEDIQLVTQGWALPFVGIAASMPIVVNIMVTNAVTRRLIEAVRSIRRPAVVFGPAHDSELMIESSAVGASFIPSDTTFEEQKSIDAVAAVIDRFSVGR